ncbi:hypothetical protein CANARDRAFT_30720 [[Candida] arabinofermentans NRRL YB-2248]|uniref:AP-1 complex subunit gamma n=1 Tax=[Candida] arabinofermentans NRRL YB-2248 TaxID=983967 RepID=A0A1E4SSX6_9ASCO|nr:hypothetical protein CANARDRAFT_30720 [[Candida] arabinofermentans NRRL YB-2248]
MSSLKSFIKAVRNSKTIATERAAIRKESAKIRTAFRDVHLDDQNRRVNISKLLYLYILGEPTYFGQVECLKLLASNTFASKRLGYLATMLILDENQEVLTLLTNSLDNDMKHPNQYVAGLALVTLGNIASPELARDLYTNVDTILMGTNPYLRKKAAIVAAKLIEKDPDLSEIFLPRIPSLLNEKSHGVVLGALYLMRSIFSNDESSREALKVQIPRLLAHLRLLTTTGYSPEYDVKGVPDPFLFVSLLQTLRILLANDDTNTNLESLNDLITQVCSKIDNAKSSANSVLYETVQTIFMINSDSSLKVLGINILSKFLTQKDNNTRYVALNTLLNVINYEPLAVQRHRATVVGCLQDGDISIRRRALELTFAIMNAQNVRVLTKELLTFLKNSDDELKPYITTQLTIACNKYSPNLKWHFETLISLLKLVGNYFSSDILSSILALVMQNTDIELTKFLVTELVKASSSFYNEYGLCLVTTWCIGEYADLILGTSYEDPVTKKSIAITEAFLVQLLETFLNISLYDESSQTNQIRIYALTAALKLSAKFKDAKNIESLRKIINSSKDNFNLEIQIRAIEYSEIFGQPITTKKGLLERMPPPPVKTHEGISLINRTSLVSKSSEHKSSSAGADSGNLLLDLLGDDDKSPIDGFNGGSSSSQQNVKHETTIDLLSDIFGMSSSIPSTTTPAAPSNSKNSDIINLFGSTTNTTTTTTTTTPVIPLPSVIQQQQQQQPKVESSVEAFNDGNLSVTFTPKDIGNGTATLEVNVANKTTSSTISNINILCAVTKHQKLQLSPITKNVLAPGDKSSLGLKITGPSGGKIKIRVKVGYELGGESVTKQFDFGSLKQTL